MVPFLASVRVTPEEVVLWVASQVDQAVALGRRRVGRDFIFFLGGLGVGEDGRLTWARGIYEFGGL